jgi:hypothetical protein
MLTIEHEPQQTGFRLHTNDLAPLDASQIQIHALPSADSMPDASPPGKEEVTRVVQRLQRQRTQQQRSPELCAQDIKEIAGSLTVRFSQLQHSWHSARLPVSSDEVSLPILHLN